MKHSLSNVLMIFGFLFILTTISVIVNNSLIANCVIGIELIILFFFIHSSIISNKKISKTDFKFFILFLFLSLIHFFLNEDSDKATFFKVLSPVVFFFTGKYTFNKSCFFNQKKRLFIFFSICFLPISIRILQLVIHVPNESYYSIFINSNNFSYYFIVCSCIVYLLTYNLKKATGFLIFGFILSKTIGSFLAILIGVGMSLREKIFKVKNLFLFGAITSLISIIIAYSKFEIVERIKGTFLTFSEITKSNNINQLSKMEYSEAIGYTVTGQDDISFLFRIKNWTEIMTHFEKSDFLNMLFGNGLMSVPKITSTHLVAHNDYLGIIYELGIIPATVLFFGYFSTLRKLKNKVFSTIFFSIAIFHFTENLYYNFLVTSLHFYLLGLISSNKFYNENPSNKQISLYQRRFR